MSKKVQPVMLVKVFGTPCFSILVSKIQPRFEQCISVENNQGG